MIGFLIGTFIGGAVGVTTMCMCAAAGNADRHMEDMELPDYDTQESEELR